MSETYLATTQSISSNPEALKAFLIGEIKGWKDNIANPAYGAQLTVDVYGKGLGLTIPEQTLESKAENSIIVSPDTEKNGLFTVTPALIEENIKTLAIGGTKITAAELFDLSLLEEIYKENPDLI